MTEAIIVAVIGAIATVLAAWFTSRRLSTPELSNSTSAKPVPQLVAFKAHDGRFVAADRNRGCQLIADRAEVGEWERFFLHEVGDGFVRLQGSDGQYVAAESGGGRELAASRVTAAEWETFRLIQRGSGRIALQTHTGLYVAADVKRGGLLVADRVEVQAWEEFELLQFH